MLEFLAKYWFLLLISSIASYFIGCINSSIIASKLLGFKNDIRNLGSGNAGFTNALRTLGKKVAILAFLGDFTKGVLAVFLAINIVFHCGGNAIELLDVKIFAYLAGLTCVLGHIFPCFFDFRGGKGILTAWASSFLIDWRVFLILISVFLVILMFTKIVSIASICAAVSYPISSFVVCSFSFQSKIEVLISTLIPLITAIIVVIKHKSNIKRILNGTEKNFV